jgi:O-antigen/teichoic acid export membrane protein
LIRHAAIPAYFALRVGSALVLLKLSAEFLTVAEFANFTQFLAFASLLNMAAVGGAQNGLIRQSAAANASDLADVSGAGLAMWAAAVPILGIPVVLFSGQVSHILTGSSAYWQAIIALTALSLLGGPGQICWSILSGRNRVARSLGAQAFGIVGGTAGAAWFILHANFVGAALAFAAGPLLASLATIPLVARLQLTWRPTTRGLTRLICYSAAMASTLTFSALTLFVLRWMYREQFGSTELGYWMAANRISDMSTQFLGLLMLQAFVPQFAMAASAEERRRVMVRYGLLGAALSGAALVVFVSAGKTLVHLFLSDAYIPAIPSITLYMIGDLCRVAVALAMFTAFAAGKPGRYAAIEICTMTMMALLAIILMKSGQIMAPQIAYVAAFALTALAVTSPLVFGLRLQHQGRWRLHVERQTPLAGSEPRLR